MSTHSVLLKCVMFPVQTTDIVSHLIHNVTVNDQFLWAGVIPNLQNTQCRLLNSKQAYVWFACLVGIVFFGN